MMPLHGICQMFIISWPSVRNLPKNQKGCNCFLLSHFTLRFPTLSALISLTWALLLVLPCVFPFSACLSMYQFPASPVCLLFCLLDLVLFGIVLLLLDKSDFDPPLKEPAPPHLSLLYLRLVQSFLLLLALGLICLYFCVSRPTVYCNFPETYTLIYPLSHRQTSLIHVLLER